MKIFSIHNHSTYSILDGVGTPERWAKHISENAHKFVQGISLSEHGTLNGIIETYEAAKKYNLKYLPSCEIYMNNEFIDNKTTRYHLVLFAIDKIGFNQLISINNKTIQRKQIIKTRTGKRIPLVTTDIIEEVIGDNKGHLKCSGACIGGYWHLPIIKVFQESKGELSKGIEKSQAHLEKAINIFGKENVYLEYQTFPKDSQVFVNYMNRRYKKKYDLKTIITSDAHVPKQGDIKYQVLITTIGWKTSLQKYLEKNEPHESVWLKGYDDFLKEISERNFEITKQELKEAARESIKIFNMIEDFSLFKEQEFYYHSKTKKEKDNLFKKLISEGWKERIENKIPKDQISKYIERLKYEVNILVEKEFIDYFLAVQEILEAGREEGLIFGPGRGSAASSLVSYLLKITNIDPLKYNLIFERFISLNRKDFPDIDVDVSDRERLIGIIQKLYPNNDVVVIANKSKFGIKSLINSVFKSLNFSYPKRSYVESGYYYSDLIDKYELSQYDIDSYMQLEEVKDLSTQIFENYGYDLRELLSILLKNLYAIGVHAGGVCILSKNQVDIPLTPVSNDKYPYGSGYSESGTYRELESVGQIKFDFLGIRTLREFEEVGRILQEQEILNKEEVRDLLLYKNVDVNEEIIYDKIKTTLTDGFFQIGSKGMKQLITKLKPSSMEELAQLIALYRPGPLQAGMSDTIQQVKEGSMSSDELWSEDILKFIEPIIKMTHYHILYQEQLMLIGKTIGEYNSADLNDFRRFMSRGYVIEKTDPTKFKRWSKKFYNAFISKGIEKGIAIESLQDLWRKMKKFSSYSFVKSHSVSYSHNAFMCSYLSHHYPAQWYTALLRHEDPIEFIPIIKEQINTLKQDIKIITPKLNKIYANPTLIDNIIVLGINQIKGIGPKAALELENIKSTFNSFDKFMQSNEYSKRAVNKGVIKKLISIGFFDDIEPNKDRLDFLYEYEVSRMKKKNRVSIDKSNFLKSVYNFPYKSELFFFKKELDMMGMTLSNFPYAKLVSEINNFMINDIFCRTVEEKQSLKSAVILGIHDVKVKKTRRGKEYLSVKMKALKGNFIWINIFSNNLKKLKSEQKVNLYQGKQLKDNLFILYYTINKEWKNFKSLISLDRYIQE